MGGLGSAVTINYQGVTINIDAVTPDNGSLPFEVRDLSLYQAILEAADSISNYTAAAFIKDVAQRIYDAQKNSPTLPPDLMERQLVERLERLGYQVTRQPQPAT
jgi:hypothetical protein